MRGDTRGTEEEGGERTGNTRGTEEEEGGGDHVVVVETDADDNL